MMKSSAMTSAPILVGASGELKIVPFISEAAELTVAAAPMLTLMISLVEQILAPVETVPRSEATLSGRFASLP